MNIQEIISKLDGETDKKKLEQALELAEKEIKEWQDFKDWVKFLLEK